jgi:hypothetical protein
VVLNGLHGHLLALRRPQLRRDNQLGRSVNQDGSVARSVTEGGRSPTGGTFLATARTHIGVHAVW